MPAATREASRPRLVITAMTSGEVQFRDWPRVMKREVIVSLMLGGFLALIGYGVAFFLAPSPFDALVIPLTLVLVIFAVVSVAERCQ